MLWRPARTMSCTIATEANTSSNQASKDPGYCIVAIVNSVKFYRKKNFGCRACGCDLWLGALPKFPVARHPPIRSKSGPVHSQQMLLKRRTFRLFNFRLSLPAFTSAVSFLPNCFTLCLERSRLSAIASCSSYKIASECEDDLIKSPQGSRDCRAKLGISTQGDNNFVRTILAAAP